MAKRIPIEPTIQIKQFASMDEIDRNISKLQRRISDVKSLAEKRLQCDDQDVDNVEARIRSTICEIYGENSPEFRRNGHHSIWHGGYNMGDSDHTRQGKFEEGIPQSIKMLEGLIEHLEEKKIDFTPAQTVSSTEAQSSKISDPIHFPTVIFEKFHEVVRQLRNRHDSRPTLDVSDEYDVQDLLHALLRLFFDDVRPEEWTPSYAGGSSRMDFLLKKESLIIEIKKTRPGFSAKELGDQLIIDIARYGQHPSCKVLLCFVYDPDGRISNPRGIERDLSKDNENFRIQVLIFQR